MEKTKQMKNSLELIYDFSSIIVSFESFTPVKNKIALEVRIHHFIYQILIHSGINKITYYLRKTVSIAMCVFCTFLFIVCEWLYCTYAQLYFSVACILFNTKNDKLQIMNVWVRLLKVEKCV